MNAAVRAQSNCIDALKVAIKGNESKLFKSCSCNTKLLNTDIQSKLNKSSKTFGFGKNELQCTNKSFITQATEIVKKHFGNRKEPMNILNVLPGSEKINQNK